MADSPGQLANCLQSLNTRQTFGYGGVRAGVYQKVTVLLADDSADARVIETNRALLDDLGCAGIRGHYFGIQEQLALLRRIEEVDLSAVVGVHPAHDFGHNGQAMMRNIAYLKMAEMQAKMLGERLLRSVIGSRFVSANLPMLHRRTLAETGQSEFRPGVVPASKAIDLCDEFERQFFGDVMLFSIERMVEQGYPDQPLYADRVTETLDARYEEMRAKYHARQQNLLIRLDRLRSVLKEGRHWWNRGPEHAEAVRGFEDFMDNQMRNFGAGSACASRSGMRSLMPCCLCRHWTGGWSGASNGRTSPISLPLRRATPISMCAGLMAWPWRTAGRSPRKNCRCWKSRT